MRLPRVVKKRLKRCAQRHFGGKLRDWHWSAHDGGIHRLREFRDGSVHKQHFIGGRW